MKVIDIIAEADRTGLGYFLDRAKHRLPVIGAGSANASTRAYVSARNKAADALTAVMDEREKQTGKDVVNNKVRSKDPSTGKRIVTQVITDEEINNIIKQSLNGLTEIRRLDGTKQVVQIGGPEHTVVVKVPVADVATPSGPKPPRKLGRRPPPDEEVPTQWKEVELHWEDPLVPAAEKQTIRDKMADRNYTLDDPVLFKKLKKEAIEQAQLKVKANRVTERDAETKRLVAEFEQKHALAVNSLKLGVQVSTVVGVGYAGYELGKALQEPFTIYNAKMERFGQYLDAKEVPKDYQWQGYTGSQKDVYSWYLEEERREKAALIVRTGAALVAMSWTVPAILGFFKLFSYIAGKSFSAVMIQRALQLGTIAVLVKLINSYSQDIAGTIVEWTFLGFKPVETIGGWFSTMNDKVVEINKEKNPSTTPNWKKQGNTTPASDNITPPVPPVNSNNPTPPVNPPPAEPEAKPIWQTYK